MSYSGIVKERLTNNEVRNMGLIFGRKADTTGEDLDIFDL